LLTAVLLLLGVGGVIVAVVRDVDMELEGGLVVGAAVTGVLVVGGGAVVGAAADVALVDFDSELLASSKDASDRFAVAVFVTGISTTTGAHRAATGRGGPGAKTDGSKA
jgi:hypothetical protein